LSWNCPLEIFSRESGSTTPTDEKTWTTVGRKAAAEIVVQVQNKAHLVQYVQVLRSLLGELRRHVHLLPRDTHTPGIRAQIARAFLKETLPG
jgi:hypothetical protein